ncbi:hypothetical protein [Streptomyces sp. NPDC056144]|uniref:hypothetical protein n=1 Tax=unclassified Streptomyces TaxID=2593676 RepID=UPI0035DE4B38
MDTDGQFSGVTAAVVGWSLEPHPQAPSEGNQVHFRFRFDGADDYSDTAVDACAVDKKRLALGCQTVSSSQAFGPADDPLTGDHWLDIEHPEQVDAVLLIPNDQSYNPTSCTTDIKDGGGTHPPGSPNVGDQL